MHNMCCPGITALRPQGSTVTWSSPENLNSTLVCGRCRQLAASSSDAQGWAARYNAVVAERDSLQVSSTPPRWEGGEGRRALPQACGLDLPRKHRAAAHCTLCICEEWMCEAGLRCRTP